MVARCGDAVSLLRAVASLRPAVVVVDIRMPPTHTDEGRMVLTLRAVEKYVSSIFGKLGLPATGSESRRVLAVLLFLRS